MFFQNFMKNAEAAQEQVKAAWPNAEVVDLGPGCSQIVDSATKTVLGEAKFCDMSDEYAWMDAAEKLDKN